MKEQQILTRQNTQMTGTKSRSRDILTVSSSPQESSANET